MGNNRELAENEQSVLIKLLTEHKLENVKAIESEIKIILWTEFSKGMLSTCKIGSSSCRVRLRR
jgi:hypothetical protein